MGFCKNLKLILIFFAKTWGWLSNFFLNKFSHLYRLKIYIGCEFRQNRFSGLDARAGYRQTHFLRPLQKLHTLTLTEGWDETTCGGLECYQKDKWQGYYFWRLAAARETWGWCCSHSMLPSETPDCPPRSRWPGHLRHESWLQHTVLSSKTTRKYIHLVSTNWGQSLKGVFTTPRWWA